MYNALATWNLGHVKWDEEKGKEGVVIVAHYEDMEEGGSDGAKIRKEEEGTKSGCKRVRGSEFAKSGCEE